MALPHNEWLTIKSGPGTWKIAQALFRDELLDPSRWCVFTVHGEAPIAPDEPYTNELYVSLSSVSRHNGGLYIKGCIEKHGDREWPHPGASEFVASYDPEKRRGSFKIIDHVG